MIKFHPFGLVDNRKTAAIRFGMGHSNIIMYGSTSGWSECAC